MKKIIGILGVAVIAATMFFSANVVSGSNETNTVSLIAMNTANAEQDDDGDLCSREPNMSCTVANPNGGVFISFRCEPDTWYTLSDCI